MREENKNYTFSAKELEIIRLMVSLGMPKNNTRVIVYLSKVGEATSKHVENAINMKQSEVSIILKWLNEKGWLSSKSVKKPSKGRPTQYHKLKCPLKNMVKDIEGEKVQEIDEMKKKIARLKSLAK
jgi:predicted transcriptional regulator